MAKEFYICFWEELKQASVTSIRVAKRKMEFTSSQKQPAIKLTQKKNEEKSFIKNWRPIYLPQIDYKILSKALAARPKKLQRQTIF